MPPPLGHGYAIDDSLAELQRLASLGTVAGVISHELNNLLTPILSYAELAAQRRNDSEFQVIALRRIVDAAQRASLVSRAVLEFASVGSTREIAQASVAEEFQHLRSLLCRQPERHRITLDTAFHTEHPQVRMRAIALQQVLLNFYLNSQSAMPNGGRLVVRTHRSSVPTSPPGLAQVGVVCECDGPWVVIEVEDTGCGIDPVILSSIWTARRSARADGTVGAGLGLVTCRSLVEQAGGGIWVESVVGQGTTFTLVLGEVAN